MAEFPSMMTPSARPSFLSRSFLRGAGAPDGLLGDPAILTASARAGVGKKACRCGLLRLLCLAALAVAVGLYAFLVR